MRCGHSFKGDQGIFQAYGIIIVVLIIKKFQILWF